MSRRTEQAERRQERAEVITQDQLYGYVFAEVVAWQQSHMIASGGESAWAEAITSQLGDALATGITRAMRREAIGRAIERHVRSLTAAAPRPLPAPEGQSAPSHQIKGCHACQSDLVWSTWHGRHISYRQWWEERNGISVEEARQLIGDEHQAAVRAGSA